MNIRQLLFTAFILTGLTAYLPGETSVSSEPDLSLSGATGAEALSEVDKLIESRQYLSAWTLLHDRADVIELGDFIVKKSELTLLYYSKTSSHQLFSFDDLDEGETLLELRRRGDSGPDLKLYDPAGALNMVLKETPGRADAWMWLGEYYYQVLTIYGDRWEKPAAETSKLALEAFRKAISLGEESGELYGKTAYCELMAGEWDAAAGDLKKALEYDGDNGEYYYNLGLAFLNLQQLEEALEYTEKALNLLDEGPEMANALFLASSIHLYMGNEGDAENVLVRGLEVSPEDYRFPDRMIRLALSREDYDGARAAASRLVNLYPDNPENFRTIVQYFYDFGKLEELIPFFNIVTDIYSGKPEIMGNIYFHKGLTEFYLEDSEASREAFMKAEEEYSKIFPEDHQVFQVIAGMRERL